MINQDLPRIAITMGDAAGIGPEIVIKALEDKQIRKVCQPIVIGDIKILNNALQYQKNQNSFKFQIIHSVDEISERSDRIPLLQPGKQLLGITTGKLSAEAGRGSVEFVRAATSMAIDGHIKGIVTAPLNKKAVHMAGFPYPGHTELLAEEFGVTNYSLVLSARNCFVFHVTTHVSLRDALDLISKERVLKQIRLAYHLAKALGREGETIAVASVNPHAGDGGLFGDEESKILSPAIQTAKKEGVPVVGPLPADVIFPQMISGKYSFVIAMYHDQGHSVFKSLYFDEGIDVTVGLPTIRTSVDHGTAFDIAGKGIAKEDSLIAAIHMAASLGPKWSEISTAAN